MEIKKGNLIDALINGEVDVLAHGTNCSNGFGSGIAGAIAHRLPEVKEQFHMDHENKLDTLGTISPVFLKKYRGMVVNCYTQEKYGRKKGHLYMSYEAMDKCMKHLANFASSNNLKVGLPKIGCGLAGGDWNIVSGIIERNFKLYGAEYVIYEL